MSHEHDPFDLRGHDKHRNQQDDKARLARQVETEDIKWLMSSKQGRRIVWRLLERTGIFKSSFTGNSETFFREGMRNVGLMLMAMVNETCPERYTAMVQEHREHANKRSADDNGTN